jgi:hypothetical protein
VEDNGHAGQGPVLLDIGGDVGALVLVLPAALAGVEIEARPVGSTGRHSHPPGADQHHHHDHLTHAAVLPRPTAGGRIVHSVVLELPAGSYELYQRPAGPVRLTATVAGGAVTEANWPA